MVQPTLPPELVEEIILVFASEFLDFPVYTGHGLAQVSELAVVHSSWTPWVRRLIHTNIQLWFTLPLLITHLQVSPSHSTADLVASLRRWRLRSAFLGKHLPRLRSLNYSHPNSPEDDLPRICTILDGIAGFSSLEHLELSFVQDTSSAPTEPNSPLVPATFALQSLSLRNVYGAGPDLALFLTQSTPSSSTSRS